jgi:hypothetical protein
VILPGVVLALLNFEMSLKTVVIALGFTESVEKVWNWLKDVIFRLPSFFFVVFTNRSVPTSALPGLMPVIFCSNFGV